MVTGAAHELRDNEKSLAADDRSGLMGMLVDQAEELTGIVEDLLVAARDDIGSVAIHFSEIDLFTEAQRAMHAAGVPGAPSGDGARALADPQRVRQTLRNLLSNAVRYGGSEIRVVISAADEWVDVTIADNGNGVPRELRDLIFEPYQSAHLPDAAVRSVGLGLYISRNLAQAMGGELTYEYDGWSRVRLRLPSVRNDQALAQDRQPGTSSLPHVTTGG